MDAAGFISDGGGAAASLKDGAVLAEFASHHEFLAALRERAAALGLSYETIDTLAGLAARYTSKVLGPKANRPLSAGILDAILDVLGVRLQLVHDQEKCEQLATRRVQRDACRARPPKVVVFTTRDYQRVGRLGFAARKAKLSPEQRSELARRAITARWAKTSKEDRHTFCAKLRNTRGAANRTKTKRGRRKAHGPVAE